MHMLLYTIFIIFILVMSNFTSKLSSHEQHSQYFI